MQAEGMQLRCPKCGTANIQEVSPTVSIDEVKAVGFIGGELTVTDADSFHDYPGMGEHYFRCAYGCGDTGQSLDCFVTGLLQWRKVNGGYHGGVDPMGVSFSIWKDGRRWDLRHETGDLRGTFDTLADAKQEANRLWFRAQVQVTA